MLRYRPTLYISWGVFLHPLIWRRPRDLPWSFGNPQWGPGSPGWEPVLYLNLPPEQLDQLQLPVECWTRLLFSSCILYKTFLRWPQKHPFQCPWRQGWRKCRDRCCLEASYSGSSHSTTPVPSLQCLAADVTVKYPEIRGKLNNELWITVTEAP